MCVNSFLTHAAGPESLEDYFQKGALLGRKVGLNFWVRRNQAKFANTVPEHLKVYHIWLIKFQKILMFFINIFQLSLSTEKRQLNYVNLAGYRRTKDLVPLFDPKVQFFQNSTGKLNIRIGQSLTFGAYIYFIMDIIFFVYYLCVILSLFLLYLLILIFNFKLYNIYLRNSQKL